MRKRSRAIGVYYLLLAAQFLSCESELRAPLTIDQQKNAPVVVSTLNAFTFTVDASQFSFERTEPLAFLTDSVVVSLTVLGFSTGNGRLSISGTSSVPFYSEDLASNKTVVQTELQGTIPKTFTIRITNYTGSVSFVLSRRK